MHKCSKTSRVVQRPVSVTLCTPCNSVSHDSFSNPGEDSQICEVDSDWSKAHVIYNGLFDWIIMNILFQSVIRVIEGL